MGGGKWDWEGRHGRKEDMEGGSTLGLGLIIFLPSALPAPALPFLGGIEGAEAEGGKTWEKGGHGRAVNPGVGLDYLSHEYVACSFFPSWEGGHGRKGMGGEGWEERIGRREMGLGGETWERGH